MFLSAALLRIDLRVEEWSISMQLRKSYKNRQMALPPLLSCNQPGSLPNQRPGKVFQGRQRWWKGLGEPCLGHFPKRRQNSDLKLPVKLCSSLRGFGPLDEEERLSYFGTDWLSEGDELMDSLLKLVWTELHVTEAGETFRGASSPELNLGCCRG